jgi:hypothetical protein
VKINTSLDQALQNHINNYKLFIEFWRTDPLLSGDCKQLSLRSNARNIQASNNGRTVFSVLVTEFPSPRPGFNPRSGCVEFVVDEVALGQVFSECLGFSCQFSFHQMLHTDLIRGWYNRPISGQRTKWTQPHHTTTTKLKKATREELLETMFSMMALSRLYN